MSGNFSKCELWLDSVNFLKHVVLKDKIQVDPKKVKALRHWPRPTSVTEILSFLGLVGYYWCFIDNFLWIT